MIYSSREYFLGIFRPFFNFCHENRPAYRLKPVSGLTFSKIEFWLVFQVFNKTGPPVSRPITFLSSLAIKRSLVDAPGANVPERIFKVQNQSTPKFWVSIHKHVPYKFLVHCIGAGY
jgi:hypothetical protein